MGFGMRHMVLLVIACLVCDGLPKPKLVSAGFACNWGFQSTHPLTPAIVVRMLKDNGFDKVKLFEAQTEPLKALGNSGIQVMLGIPNDFLAQLAGSVSYAEQWVTQNVSNFISKHGTDIRYIAVGNEPFLKTYGDKFMKTMLPALENIQAALIKAGLGRQVKVTIPINADVYQTESGLPSGGDFRSDIHVLMMSIIKFLSDNAAPLTINIYPFLSLQADANFPVEYAFFNGNAAPVVDGSISYTNVLDANFDTLIAALEKNGFSSLPVIVGEVGWPTDGDPNANAKNAQRFYQGLVARVARGQGTPKRSTPPDTYMFALTDEDAKSVDPGNFERHWGMFNFDGSLKYQLDLGNGKSLVPAKGVRYLKKQWCVLSPSASPDPKLLQDSLGYACTYADCTSLGYGSSCGAVDARANASFAFNAYFQTMDQRNGACEFSNLGTVTTSDPSQGTCRFQIMIDLGKHERPKSPPTTTTTSPSPRIQSTFVVVLLFLLPFIIIPTLV